MCTTGKTPVSLLNEMLVHKKIQPIYNLIMSGAGTNQGTFMYEVTAGELLKARGRGRSKKEAKQDAAKSALAVLKSGLGKDRDENSMPIPNLDVISPYQAQLRENAVGELIELCTSSQLPVPDYILIREDGPPHAKTFELTCKVSSFEQSAVGRTKQQAKQMAAKLMLEALGKLKLTDEISKLEIPKPHDYETEEERASLLAAIHAERAARGLNRTKGDGDMLGKQMGARFKHDWTLEKLAQVKSLRVPTTDYYEQLQEICIELDLKLSCFPLKSANPMEDLVHIPNTPKLGVVRLYTQPKLTFLGSGRTEEAAYNKASSRALEFFDIMVCQ